MCVFCHQTRLIDSKKASKDHMAIVGAGWPFRSIPNSGPCVSWSSHWMRAIPSGGPLVRWPLLCVCVCVFSCSLSCISFEVTPWTVACQAPLSMEFFRQEYWSGLLFPSPGDLPNPGIRLMLPLSHALAGRFFTTAPPGKPSHSPWPKALLSWGLSWQL